MNKSKILCVLLSVALAVSLSRDQQIRGLYRKYSNRFRRRAKALADAWVRPMDSLDYPAKGSPA